MEAYWSFNEDSGGRRWLQAIAIVFSDHKVVWERYNMAGCWFLIVLDYDCVVQ